MNESNKVIIQPRTVDKLLDDLTHTNGPGVHFILIGVMDGKSPAIMSTLDPDSMDEAIDWLVEHRGRRKMERIDLDKDSTKKGN